jgi:hypothetical protein
MELVTRSLKVLILSKCCLCLSVTLSKSHLIQKHGRMSESGSVFEVFPLVTSCIADVPGYQNMISSQDRTEFSNDSSTF